jgi:WD40 repeat protein
VEPVTSPTDLLSQTVTVIMENMGAVTITTESGVFTGAGPQVEVTLLPDTVHHLKVVARVREIWQGHCRFGGYTLRTTRDTNGDLLIIEQGQPVPRHSSGAVIEPSTISQLAPLFSVAPGARLAADFVFSSDRELISVGYADEISCWDLPTGQETEPLGKGMEEAAALCVAVDSGRSLVATGGTAEDPAVRLWNTVSGDMRQLGRHEALLTGVAFSPNGTRLASGDSGNKVWVWDVGSGEPIAFFEGDVPNRYQAFYDLYWPDDRTLVAAGSDAVYWWDLSTGELLERLARPDQAAFFVDYSFSQGGQRLAAAAQDENVYFWDRGIAEWQIWPALPGASLNHVEFSPDGQLLAATTFSGDLLLWDVQSQELLADRRVTTSDIAAVRFSPGGQYLAVGGWDLVIWLWGIP